VDKVNENKMSLSICSDSEDDVERTSSAKTSIDHSSLPWPNNIVNFEDVSRLAIVRIMSHFYLE